MSSPDPYLVARSRLANASHRGGDPAAIIEARRDFTAVKLERYIREVVASAPPLTTEQRARLAALLSGGASA